MPEEVMPPVSKIGKALRQIIYIGLLLASLILLIAVSSACSGEKKYSIVETADDGIYAFKVTSATLVENVGDQKPIVIKDGKVQDNYSFLVIECEIENVNGQQDVLQYWNQQITGKGLGLVYLRGQKQLGNVTLQPGQKESGNVTFTTKDNVRDFTLKFKFPVSEDTATYEFRADDLRLNVYVDHVLEKIEQRERVKNIPVIGGVVERFTRASLKYYGEVLVPEADVSSLLKQLDDLTEEEQREVIKGYVCKRKGWDCAPDQASALNLLIGD